MKIQKAIKDETRHIAIGVLIGDVLAILVFLLLKKLDGTVIAGLLLGSCYAVLNFFAMGLSVQKVTEGNMDQQTAAKYMKSVYNIRMFGIVIVVAIGALVPWFNVIAVIIPLFFPQITAAVLARKIKNKEAVQTNQERGDE